MKPTVLIFTDGACSGNPGMGAWAAVLLAGKKNEHRKVLSDIHLDTTSNQMELHGVLNGLEALKTACDVRIFTDSVNVIGWLYGWNRQTKEPDAEKKFKTKDPNIKVLVDAINQVIEENGHDLTLCKVEAHSENVYNNLADKTAKEAISNAKLDSELLGKEYARSEV
jgi:ribonuclease HI